MSEKRFVACETLIEDYVESMENRSARVKTKRDVQLFELRTFEKGEERREGSAQDCANRIQQLYLAGFIRSLRRKDGELKTMNPQVYNVSSPALKGI